jgi:hypothetical protein
MRFSSSVHSTTLCGGHWGGPGDQAVIWTSDNPVAARVFVSVSPLPKPLWGPSSHLCSRYYRAISSGLKLPEQNLITHLYLGRRVGIHGTGLAVSHNSSWCGVQINEEESFAMFAVYVRNYKGDAKNDLGILKGLHASSIPE